MPKLSDMLGGDGEGSKSAAAAGSASAAMADVSSEAEKLAKLFSGEVGGALQNLKDQLEANVKQIDAMRKAGKLSGKEAAAMLDRQNAEMERLNKTIAAETKGKVTDIKQAKILRKLSLQAMKQAKEEQRILRARRNDESTALLELTAQLKDTAKAAKEAAKAAAAAAPGKALHGAGRAGQRAADALPGSGGVGPGNFGGGAMNAVSAAGPWGAILGAMLKVGSAVANKNREAAIAVTQRFINYGGNLDNQVGQVKNAFVKAGEATLKFNGDLEATQSAMARIWTQTGEVPSAVGENIKILEEMRFIGIGSIDELADNTIKRMNQTGMSFKDAALEMKGITLQAQALRKDMGENVIQMDDFYKGVQELSEGIESMNVNQVSLGKSFATNLKIGKKLGLSYERNIAAAKGLTRALTDNYDEGFATLEVNEDLAAAMQSKNAKGELTQVAKDAKVIADDLQRGFITQDRAAEMLKEIGGTTDEKVIQARIMRAAESGVVLPMLEARLGKLSFDQQQVFKDIQGRINAGEDIAKILPTLSAKDRASYEGAVKQATEKQIDPAKAANLLLDKILVSLSEVLPDMLQTAITVLQGMDKALKYVGKALGWDEEGMKKEQDAEMQGLEEEGAKDVLLNKIKTNLGMEASRMDDEELMERFAADKGLRAKVGHITESMKAGIVEELGAEEGEQVYALATAEAKIRKREKQKEVAAAKEKKVTSVQINDMKPHASGTNAGTADVTTVPVEQKGAAKTAEKVANVNKRTAEQTRSQSPKN